MTADGPSPDEAPVSTLDPAVAACPHAAYRQLREFHDGVSRTSLMKVPLIARYDDVVRALRDTETFSSEMAEELALGTERPMIPQQIDSPRQTRYRKLLDPLFSRRRSLTLEPEVRHQANARIDRFIDNGGCEFDSSVAIPLACSVFLSLFGLPYEHLDLFLEMKAGGIVTLLLGSANLDERQFECADQVDFDRERNRHMAFGGDPHRCLASHLARMELRVALEEWHRRIPDYAIVPGETPTYSPGIREVQYLPLVWGT